MEENVILQASSCQMKELFIFNSKFGNEENEIEKVLYFYPKDLDDDTMLKKVGLCEAIIKFSDNFSKDYCDSLHTLKSRYIFLEPEPGFWFVLVISIPSVVKTSPEGLKCTEYQDDQVQDNVFRAIISRIYHKFVFLHNSLEDVLQHKGYDELKAIFGKFYDAVVKKIDPSSSGVLDILQGLKYFSLERQIFLDVQCFVNLLLLSWPQIKYLLLLQRDKLIWSGIGHNDIRVVYEYLIKELLSQHFHSGADKQSTYGMIFKRESHVTLAEISNLVHNNNKSEGEDEIQEGFEISNRKRYHVLIYKAEQSYLTMFFEENQDLDRKFINGLESFLSMNYSKIAKELSKSSNTASQNNVSNSSDPNLNTVKYVYFNNLNLAQKISPGCMCEPDPYKLLADLNFDLTKISENGEIVVKMISESWVIAKVSNKREFYAMFNHKGSNLIDIDEEMRKLTDAHLTNIFFQD